MDLAAPWHVPSPWTRDQTHVRSIGRWNFIHGTVREVLHNTLLFVCLKQSVVTYRDFLF